MRNPLCQQNMGDEPSVEAFMRHLQVCVEEARTIADPKERSSVFSNESALQVPSFTKTELRTPSTRNRPHPLVEAESSRRSPPPQRRWRR